ncbi:MAG TPA: hypothetical protein PLW44_11235 [Chitinophagales bacterium]|nr:hypothetical protein [Chitinophagales bacterium]
MNTASNPYWSDRYSNLEWKLMKFFFIPGWFFITAFIYNTLVHIGDGKSVCAFFDCNVILTTTVKLLLFAGMAVFSVLYILEKQMLLSLTVLSALSVLVFSAGESNGIAGRCEILSAVLIAQLVAYIKHKRTGDNEALAQDRIQYSVQIIAAAYILAAISKLRGAGIGWVLQHKQLAIHAKSGFLRPGVHYGTDVLQQYADMIFSLFWNHPVLTAVLLTLALVIEGAAIICFLGKRYTQLYGILLAVFHLSLFILMFVFVPPVLLCVFVFVLNGPLLIYMGLGSVYNKIRYAKQ